MIILKFLLLILKFIAWCLGGIIGAILCGAIFCYIFSGFGALFMFAALTDSPGVITYILCGLNVVFWVYLLFKDFIYNKDRY